jgi:hypothetical protein
MDDEIVWREAINKYSLNQIHIDNCSRKHLDEAKKKMAELEAKENII